MAARPGFAVHFDLRGDRQLAAALSRLARDVPHKAGRALREEGDIEGEEADRRTPFQSGRLVESREVTGPDPVPGGLEVRIRYGNETVPYALIQHQTLQYRHPQGRSQFLRSTVLESRRHLLNRVARAVLR